MIRVPSSLRALVPRRHALTLCGLALVLCSLVPAGPAGRGIAQEGPLSEVVVTLAAPAVAGRSGLAGRAARAAVDADQARFVTALRASIPTAQVRWRYRLVLNGAAVVVPTAALPLLRALPGVKEVDASTAYASAATEIAAGSSTRAAWQAGLPNQGEGIKIAIIDDGIDQRHPYFSATGYTMPPGFPRGQIAYTTAKVIVARAFAPAGTTWQNARKPFDPLQSGHATHVAGIAAGNANTPAPGGARLSGVASRAYLGNYKALTVPTDAGVGLDGNAAEIVAAIEAAVADGMNVINLSIGEPEVEPSRDLVALALDAAAAAGVVPVVAAGNDFDEFGGGSVASPGTSAQAITVAAVSSTDNTLAGFSAAGPTPISLRLKPDISAPGVSVLSSVPNGRWEPMSGTSMATPQVAGVAALLLERHPSWSVAQLKSALVGSGAPVQDSGSIAAPTRGGGGLADAVHADVPLVLASPASVSFGLVRPATAVASQVELADAGGGAGVWDVSIEMIAAAAGAGLTVAPTVSVPGTLQLLPVVADNAAEGDVTGFVRLARGTDVRRIPFWLRVERPALAAASSVLRVPGIHLGNTRGKPARVSRYRYPDVGNGGAVTSTLLGPEQVFRIELAKPVANFGVVVVRRGKGVRVEPRVVAGGDENRLTGFAALPVNLNPYLSQFGEPVLAAAAVRPLAGAYDVVFDSASPAGAGSFAFRYWIDDTRPPTVTLGQRRLKRGLPFVVHVADAGSGIDPATVNVTIDGETRVARLEGGVLRIPTAALRRGTHGLRVQVSDYQESRNMESVPPILPNTRVLATTVVVR